MEKNLKTHSHHNLITELIKTEASLFGFDGIGIVKAHKLTKEGSFLQKWLAEGNHDGMEYLKKNAEKLSDPEEVFSNAKSVIVVIMNYFPADKQNPLSDYKIAKYAYGKDYHTIIKERLELLANFVETVTGNADTKIFVDSGLVLEKTWAVKAGLGWQGKHSIVINPNIGSFFFIGCILTDFVFEYDQPIKDQCGNCTLCMDACPTKAIIKPYSIDARKCIACQTIESKGREDAEFSEENKVWIYGCDVCQDVCPWNKNVNPCDVHGFEVRPIIAKYNTEDWENLTEEDFSNAFSESAIHRIKYKGLARNIGLVMKNRKRDA